MEHIKLAWINDWMGSLGNTSEEEAQQEAQYLRELLGKQVELVVCDRSLFPHRDKKLDLVVLDYGGVFHGAWDTAKVQIEYACTWAKDHPSTIVLIYTLLTQQIFDESIEQFKGIENIKPYPTDTGFFGVGELLQALFSNDPRYEDYEE